MLYIKAFKYFFFNLAFQLFAYSFFYNFFHFQLSLSLRFNISVKVLEIMFLNLFHMGATYTNSSSNIIKVL